MGEFVGEGDLGHRDFDDHLAGRLVQPRQDALDGAPALRVALEHDDVAHRIHGELATGA